MGYAHPWGATEERRRVRRRSSPAVPAQRPVYADCAGCGMPNGLDRLLDYGCWHCGGRVPAGPAPAGAEEE
jgi:hypothetical protein